MNKTNTRTYNEYAGFVKNLQTGKYDILFKTEISELLAYNRAIEHANNENELSKPTEIYNLHDTIVKKRTVTQTFGQWRKVKTRNICI